MSSKNAGQLEEVIYHQDKSRAVLIFKENQTVSQSAIMQRFDAKSNNIISASFAYQREGFDMYPNPANNSIHIRHATPIQSIKITSVQGKVIKELRGSTQFLDTVNLSGLEPGLYIIVIESEGKVEYKRLFKR